MLKKGNLGNLNTVPFDKANVIWPNGSKFGVTLSHDVDRTAKSYQYFTRSLRGKFEQLKDIFSKVDPYWQFDEILKIENKYDVKSTFFFLDESLAFDLFSPSTWKFSLGRYKIDSSKIANQIKKLDSLGWEVGLHGSINSYNNPELLQTEKERLEKILGKKIYGIRQHYLNLKIPETWHMQKQAGFNYDASFGLKKGIGFKDGIDAPFFVLDSSFLVIPITIMDGYLFGRYKSSEEAWEACVEIIDKAEINGSLLSVLWHQRVFYERDFPDYRKIYEKIIQECLKRGAWFGTSEQIYKHIVRSDKS